MKALHVCILSFLVSACGGDNSDTEEQGGIINCENRICSDYSGDAAFSFIDIGEVKIKIENSNVVVDVKLLDIPDYLAYNSENVPDGYAEYSWTVTFDVDRDDSSSNDIMLSVAYIKNISAPEIQDSLLDLTMKNVYRFPNGGAGQLPVIGHVILTQDNNTMTLTVPKNSNPSLEEINETTPFMVNTFYNSAGTVYEDRFPDYEGYIQ